MTHDPDAVRAACEAAGECWDGGPVVPRNLTARTPSREQRLEAVLRDVRDAVRGDSNYSLTARFVIGPDLVRRIDDLLK